MKNNWVQSNSSFFLREVSMQIADLPPHIFKVNCTPLGELYLDRVKEKFEFPYKVYGLETKFIDRVITTYSRTRANLGVLMNGIRGTGKTVTAEMICNKLAEEKAMPVILVSANYPGLVPFLASIQQNVVLLFDEFEKIFGRIPFNGGEEEGPSGQVSGGTNLLTIMDGTLSGSSRKVFILTTNNLYVEENLIQRPSRIRYLKKFGNLSKESIIQIVDDKLIHTKHREKVIEFIAQLELITVDIVSQVVQEVNIHDQIPEDFADIFNVKKVNMFFDVYEVFDGEKVPDKLIAKKAIAPITEALLDQSAVGSWLQVGRMNLGEIESNDGWENIICKMYKPTDYAQEDPTIRKFRIERAFSYNSTFSSGLY